MPGNILPFIRTSSGGFSPPPGFVPVKDSPKFGSNNEYEQYWQNSLGQQFEVHTDKGPLPNAPWAYNSPTSFLIPKGEAPSGETPLQFIDRMRDILPFGKESTGKSIYEMSASGGASPYDSSKGRQVDLGGGRIDIGKGPGSPKPSDIGNPETPFFLWDGGKPKADAPAAPGTPASGSSSIPGGFRDAAHASDVIRKVSLDVKDIGVDTKGKTISDILKESLSSGETKGTLKSEDENLPNPNLGPAPQFDAYQTEMMLRGNYGIDSMTSQIESIDKQIIGIREEEAAKYENIRQETVSSAVRGKESAAVAAGVRGEIAALTAQRTLLTKQISIAQKGVSLMMSKDKSDYETAKSAWTKEYNENLKYIHAFEAGTTPQQKHEAAALTQMLKTLSLTPGRKLTQDELNTLEELVSSRYGPEFRGIWDELPEGFSLSVYSKSFTGADGKKYIQNLSLNKDGSFSVTYTTPASKTSKGYGTITKGDYSNLQNTFGVSTDYVNGVIDSYNSGTTLNEIRNQMKKDNVDPAALDWIMHYYAPLANKTPGTKKSASQNIK